MSLLSNTAAAGLYNPTGLPQPAFSQQVMHLLHVSPEERALL
jgi:hypothetical protein